MKTQRDLQLPVPLESLKSFLDQQGAMDGGRLVCHECGSVMGHVDGTFWLYGTDGEWMLHLPVCACSERESLGSPNQRREECPTSEPATSLVAGAGWKEMYRTALFEPDKRKQRRLLQLAEKAVVFRARELFHAKGVDVQERQALDAAMYALRALLGFASSPRKPKGLLSKEVRARIA